MNSVDVESFVFSQHESTFRKEKPKSRGVAPTWTRRGSMQRVPEEKKEGSPEEKKEEKPPEEPNKSTNTTQDVA